MQTKVPCARAQKEFRRWNCFYEEFLNRLFERPDRDGPGHTRELTRKFAIDLTKLEGESFNEQVATEPDDCRLTSSFCLFLFAKSQDVFREFHRTRARKQTKQNINDTTFNYQTGFVHIRPRAFFMISSLTCYVTRYSLEYLPQETTISIKLLRLHLNYNFQGWFKKLKPTRCSLFIFLCLLFPLTYYTLT